MSRQHLVAAEYTSEIEGVMRETDDSPAKCWLCESDDDVVFRGLGTFGIEYPGDVRFICGTCISKIKRA